MSGQIVPKDDMHEQTQGDNDDKTSEKVESHERTDPNDEKEKLEEEKDEEDEFEEEMSSLRKISNAKKEKENIDEKATEVKEPKVEVTLDDQFSRKLLERDPNGDMYRNLFNNEKAEPNVEVERKMVDKFRDQVQRENARQHKKKRRQCLLCLVILLIVVLILLEYYFFLVPLDDNTSGRSVDPNDTETDVPTSIPTTSPTALVSLTESPTVFQQSPSISPTQLDTTSAPTSFPFPGGTPFPSVSPTPTGENEMLSELDCESINVASQGGLHGEHNFNLFPFEDTFVCSDTYGPDPLHPNRNPWAVAYGRRDCPTMGFDDGREICEEVGARLCSLAELESNVGQGTGCGGDRQAIWSYSRCKATNGNNGHYMFDFGLRDKKESAVYCITDSTVKSVVRCCGDLL